MKLRIAILAACASTLTLAFSATMGTHAQASRFEKTFLEGPNSTRTQPNGSGRSVVRPGNQIGTGTMRNKKIGTDGKRTNRGISDNNSPIPRDR
jgi:hypothetical protein